MESIKDHLPVSLTDATTALGSIPVICVACSRPVKFETVTGIEYPYTHAF